MDNKVLIIDTNLFASFAKNFALLAVKK